MKLRWSEVDFSRNAIYVTQTKSGKDRAVPLNAVARSVLLELKQGPADSGPVFISAKTGDALRGIKHGFARACLDAKVEGLRFHDLRHTFGTRLADAGADPFTIAELLGHADLRMTARYTHATEQNRRRAVERLTSYGQSQKIVTRLSQF